MSGKISITLTTHEDWDVWIESIKTIAEGKDIWEFINPNTPSASLPEFTRPVAPKPGDVKAGATSVEGLTPAELDDLKEQRKDYRIADQRYNTKREALGSLRAIIQSSVSEGNLVYTFGCDTVYDILVSLKTRFAPTTKARERQLIHQYQQLRKLSKTADIDEWLLKWETTYTQCKKFDLPDVQGSRAIYDFVDAADQIHSGFADYWINHLREIDDDRILSLYEIVQRFRDYRMSNSSKLKRFDVAFSTLKGKGQDKDSDTKTSSNQSFSKDQSADKKRECLCGRLHSFDRCYYLIETIRPKNWTPNAEVQRKIDEILESKPRIRGAVEAARRRAKKSASEEMKDDRKEERK